MESSGDAPASQTRGRHEHGVHKLPKRVYALAHSETALSTPFSALTPDDWETIFGHLVAHEDEKIGRFEFGEEYPQPLRPSKRRTPAYILHDALYDYLHIHNCVPYPREQIEIPFERTLLPATEKGVYERAMVAWNGGLKDLEPVYVRPPPVPEPPGVWDVRLQPAKASATG